MAHDPLEEPVAVLEGATPLIAAPVGVGGEELADQKTVTRVYLDGVESGPAGEASAAPYDSAIASNSLSLIAPGEGSVRRD
jgi:hypothetical protein